MSDASNLNPGNSIHYSEDPARKARFKSALDDFISREKEILSGQDREGDELELQYRLDNFMHRLHERAEELMNERGADGSEVVSEPLAGASVMDELLPASEVLYLEESFGEERAAEVVRSIEEEFGVYKIGELNAAVHSDESILYKLTQGTIGVVIALSLAWLLWPSGSGKVSGSAPQQVRVAAAKSDIATEVSAVGKGEVSPPAITNKLTVLISIGNVRDRPSASAAVLFQIRQGTVVRELDVKWGWHQIRLQDGRTGWAYKALFSQPEKETSTEKNTLNESASGHASDALAAEADETVTV